ncbi:hypothetical protein ACFYP4_21555 [Streptomyces sp. NPDC005551]|uniref:hypothetical protein n=1 Tax=unclassified Streptomyces TaxID=2593676 RepID=UPI00340E75FA
MDADAVADELYGLRPEQFTAVRNQRAAAARTAGDRALSERISGMRRPSLSAWASNLLVREQRDEIQPLVRLGEALRQAHQDLDGGQLRQLAGQQQALIRALSQQAKQLAAEHGHPLGDGALREVEQTLQAVLGDADAAREWAAGRLAKPLSPAVGFPAVARDAVTQGRAAPTDSEPRAAASGPRAAGGTDSAAQARRRKRLAEARRTAEGAERDLAACATEAEEAGRAAREARELSDTSQQHVTELRQRIAELTEDLENAEEQQRRARADRREAQERERTAGRRLSAARSRAGKAAAEVDRLTDGDPEGNDAAEGDG